MIADGNLPSYNRLPWSGKAYQCHEVYKTSFLKNEGQPGTVAAAANAVYQRMISPFTDALCLFVKDIGGVDTTIEQLALWVAQERSSIALTKPALVLVVEKSNFRQMRSALAAKSRKERGSWLESRFRDVRVVTLTAKTRKRGGRRYHRLPAECSSRVPSSRH